MNICIYGASSNEIDKIYIDEGEKVGKAIAENGHTLVFGGGSGGMMGAAARGATEKSGIIIGITPSFFNVDGVLYDKCTEMIYTETMRERKQKMEDLSEVFIMLPGGIGTFEEFFEILILKQLGRHNKPIIIMNINGYFDNMVCLIQNAINQNFMTEACSSLYKICDSINSAMEYINNYDYKANPISYYKGISTENS